MNAVRLRVAVGGAAGALARLGLIALVVGTTRSAVVVLLANLAGAFVLGWLVARARTDARWRARLPLVGTGLLGAFTTFSTLAQQIAALATDARLPAALVLATASIVGGTVVAAAGLRLGARGELAGPP